MFLTYTRAPIVARIPAGVVVAASPPKTRLIPFLFLVLAARLPSSRPGADLTIRAPSGTRDEQEQDAGSRLIHDWSLELAAERPVFGCGAGSFDRVKNTARFSSGDIPRAWGIGNTSYNMYLTILVEYGGIGLALLLAPWITITIGALKMAAARPEVRWFVVGSIAAIAVYVLLGNTLEMRFFSFVPGLPWLFLGLLRRGGNFQGVAAFESR